MDIVIVEMCFHRLKGKIPYVRLLHHYYFLWSKCHVIISYTKFQINWIFPTQTFFSEFSEIIPALVSRFLFNNLRNMSIELLPVRPETGWKWRKGKLFFFYVPANAIKMIKRHIRNTGTHCNRKGADITRNEELSFKYEMLQCYSNCQWQVHSV